MRCFIAALAITSCASQHIADTTVLLSTTSVVSEVADSSQPAAPATTTTVVRVAPNSTQTSMITTTTLLQIPKRQSAAVESWRCPEWVELGAAVGFSGDDLLKLDKIIWRESRCQPDAFNPDDPMGGSMGLTQINSFWVQFLCEAQVACERSNLFDPVTSLIATRVIWMYGVERHGSGWGPWNP